MRDILLLFIFPIFLYYIFRRPYIGASFWIWSAMFFPNGWVFGIASGIRFNLIIAAATIFSYVFQKDKVKTDLSGITVLVLFFLFWTTVSSSLTLSDPEVVWHEWNLFMKIVVFYGVCILTLKTKHHINIFLWAIALSASYFGATEGVKYILSGGGHVLQGISGSRLSDRNELALAINMTIPILIFLLGQTKHSILRLGLLGAIIFCIVAVVGSFSRGGLLGLLVVGVYFFIKSKKKILVSVLLTITLAAAVNFVPDKWFNRMDTIQEMDTDGSFLGRIVAWKQAVLMASDNPVFGAGFKAGQNQVLWKIYEADFYKLDFIIDTRGYTASFPKAAHSIYFQVLGDHGFVGLLLFLWILLLCYRNLVNVIKNSNDPWMIDLSKMLQVVLLAYCVGGAALSLPYFDLSFSIFALSASLTEIMRRQVKEKQQSKVDDSREFMP